MNRSGSYHALAIKPTSVIPPYFIVFNYAPSHLKFFLNKSPTFIRRADAFRALENYRFEFGVDGVVMSEQGVEAEPLPVYDVEFIDADVPQ